MKDRPWHHLAALAVALAAIVSAALASGTPTQDALIPGAVGFWSALMFQIAAGCYDRWL